MEAQRNSVKRREILKALTAVPLAALIPFVPCRAMDAPLIFSCSVDNDLYGALNSQGIVFPRYETPTEAVTQAPAGSGVLILAENYPRQTIQLEPKIFQEAVSKRLRLYIEFPSFVPDMEVGKPTHAQWGKNRNVLDRVVVATDALAPKLRKLRILTLHDCLYVPVSAENSDLVLARVAGYNYATFGLPQKDVESILFKHSNKTIMIATTKLSNFITGRYAPLEGWEHVWRWILTWLCSGHEVPLSRWTPTVYPSYRRLQELPQNAELNAFKNGVAWYSRARLFVASSWRQMVQQYASIPGPDSGPQFSWPMGDGSEGVLEGFSSNIEYDGTQPVGWSLRADCAAETSMAMAFSSVIESKSENRKISTNLNDFIYFHSSLGSGSRNDPNSPSFGLIGWESNKSGVYYGDDNARSMMGTMAAAALLKSSRWDEKVMRCLLANLRTTGKLGFRSDALNEIQMQKLGWRHFYEMENINYAPHFEAYLWACFLRAYDKTQYAPFLERARNAIQMTMAAYPDQWRWTNGLQQERARMLLPLAWLIRTHDTREHRQWLKHIAEDLLALQDESGAIREELGTPGMGQAPPPASNEQYGTAEAPLIQENGDPACDLLYTMNFAFLGLHEAAAATGDLFYIEAENKLAKFLCRIQVRTITHPELDGGWYRAFDFKRWDYWASNSDWGWGVWSIETGWTQAWICSVLAMRHMNTSLWQLTSSSEMSTHLDALLPIMFS